MTNYERYFGTIHKAADTFERICDFKSNCSTNCSFYETEVCDKYDNFLEWLESESDCND